MNYTLRRVPANPAKALNEGENHRADIHSRVAGCDIFSGRLLENDSGLMELTVSDPGFEALSSQ